MATKKDIRRTKIKFRIRHKVSGTAEMPRLSVFRSNKEIYAQVIDDVKGVTLTAASSLEKGFEKSGTKSLPRPREELGRRCQRRWFKILISHGRSKH